jgi:hypothetical protein
MAATRRTASKKGETAAKAKAATGRETPVRPSSGPAATSGGRSPTPTPKAGRTAPRVRGSERTPEQVDAARERKRKRDRDRQARLRKEAATASARDAVEQNAKAKRPSKAKGKTTAGRRNGTVRFRPAAPEDFEAVEKALSESAEVMARERKLTPQERVDRDEAVVSSLAMGLTAGTVARHVGLSVGQVEQIQLAARDRYREQVPRGEAVLWDALRGLDSNIEQAAQMAAVPEREGEGEAPPTPLRLGALKLKHELQTARLELLLAMGLISASPATYERERQARDYLLRLLEGLREAGVSDDVIERVASDAMPVDIVGDTVAAARRPGDEGRTITTA